MARGEHTRPVQPPGEVGAALGQQSERVVAAALLRDPALVDELAALAGEGDFTVSLCQEVFRAVRGLTRAGRPADLATVADEVHRRTPWDCPARMASDMADLWHHASGNAAHHARRVRDAATLRRLADAGAEIAAIARRPPGPAAEALAEAARLLSAVEDSGAGAGPVPLADVLDEVFDRIDARQAGGVPPAAPSGLASLDELTLGFRPGELVILAARPSVGKTSIGLAFARAAALSGRRVLFASCEMGREELGERMLSAEGRVDSLILRDPDMGEGVRETLLAARNRLAGLPVLIDDGPRQSAFHVASAARRVRRKGGLGLVVVDYVGLMAVEEKHGKKRHELVGEISRELKLLARELGVPLLLMAQLNREVESRGANARPRLSDLRESGSLEQDADVVILLHRPAEEPGAGARPWRTLELIVAKNRNGPTGECRARFVPSQMRFLDDEPAGPFDDGGRAA